MATQIVETMVEGGKATAAPPLGPALGPTGVNIGLVVSKINEKTNAFKGMQVPVKVIINPSNKSFEIEVGRPPASALIKKESNIEKGSGKPNIDKVADVLIEQIIKIAKMKEEDLAGKTLKERVKEVIGTCSSMGILVEGKDAKEAIRMVDAGKFDAEIKAEKTELTAEELKQLEEERKRLEAEALARVAREEATAKQIISEMSGKERGIIKARLVEVGISKEIIDKLLPVEGVAAAAGAAPSAGAPAAGAAPTAAKAAAPAKK
jgi:large subunit ribosomal protein L11